MAIVVWILTGLLVLDCLILLVVILIQRGKGGGLSSSLGGMGGGESAFGTRAATTAKKATAVLAVIFIGLTIALGLVSRRMREPGIEPANVQQSGPGPASPEKLPTIPQL